MKLIVLGSFGTWARPGGAASGYLLEADRCRVWLDAGTGTLASLQAYADPFSLDAIVVSHRHFDHFLDLYPYSFARLSNGLDRLPLHAPPGMFEHAARIEESLPDAFESRPVEVGATFEIGPFRFDTAPMVHPVPTLGMRISSNGSTLAYSADTGPTDQLVAIARGADVLLSESTYARPGEGPGGLHLAARQAGEHAARAGVGRLVLTHIRPEADRDVAREEAAAAYEGDVAIASEGLEVTP